MPKADDEPTMQACYYTKYGKPAVLQMGSLPKAKLLAPEEVLVQVYAASINPIDYKRREGGLKAVLETKWPQIVGYDLAGVVVLAGANVKQFRVGDEVFACLPHDRPGSLAEYVSVAEQYVAAKPQSLSFVQAAALPISSLVALQTLRRLELREGQKLLLTGGSGGVGTLALQMAKNVFKAGTVATTASQQKEHILTPLGADLVIDYTEQAFETVVREYDVAMDCTSEAKKCMECVTHGGMVASIADTPPPEALDDFPELGGRASCCLGFVLGCLSYSIKSKARANRLNYEYVFVAPSGAMLAEVAAWCTQGLVRPVIDKVYPFEQALEALELLESGHVTGKVVVEFSAAVAHMKRLELERSGSARNHRQRHSAGDVPAGEARPEIKPRKLSHIQVVKMGQSSRAIGVLNAPVAATKTVPLTPEGEAVATDITEELRSAAPNLGRDVIALSTTATPVQVSMSPQEEMLTHVHLEKAMKNHSDADDVQKNFVKELLTGSSSLDPRHHAAHPKLYWFVLHPHGRVRLRWDVFCILLIYYNAFVIPFQAAFLANADANPIDVNINYTIDIIFAVDILSNFVTGVEVKGKVHFEIDRIARKYLQSWFIVDFASTFPFTAVVSGSNPTVVRALKLFRLLRLLRLFRMLRILNRLQHALLIRSTISSLFRYCLTVVFVSHWFACFFFWVSYQDSMFSDPPINTWLHEKHLLDASIWDQYVTALYWAIMTLATVGYGDVSAVSPNERCFAVLAMFVGAGIFAYGITNIVSLVSSLTAHETAFREKMDEINEYMAARDLPKQLRAEIRDFFQNARKSKENDMLQEQELLNELSAMLRSKIALAINDHFLWKFPFFKGSDPNFIMDLALSMRMICFAPFEDVCVEGELGHEMFFIFRGAVEVLKDDVQITVLGENQYFGEMAILNRDCKRMATVRTLCFCELRMLSRVRFLEALVHFPKMMEKLANYSKARANGINQAVAFGASKPDSEGSSGRAVRRKSSTRLKPAGYRFNWRNPRQSDPKLGDGPSETIVHLDHIKRVQDVLSTKVREMHTMLDAMVDTDT
ncbi:Voltage-gated Ion Channel (VIC) Superfamily [Achlya hypogyna]|uniref:Voltage-gated Ion Channel (VIC) Superfamily n=1 Tax=Achlya hypogyna TaxID=1202772 RepID=A0A1V9YB41_ACHHY|nr:Voltage-gated Ion Channel (VIC) Superfamily [Achlya hypogyna]